jgi:hypothetical protein
MYIKTYDQRVHGSDSEDSKWDTTEAVEFEFGKNIVRIGGILPRICSFLNTAGSMTIQFMQR